MVKINRSKNRKRDYKIMSILFLIILLANSVSAFGVSSPYWKDNPAQMPAGESGTLYLYLQNMVGDQDVTVNVRLTEGSEIATVEERNYFVKAQTKDVPIPINIKIPKNAPIGTSYTIKVSSETVTPGDSGGVAIGLGMDTKFEVLVVEGPPSRLNSKTAILAAAIIIILIIVWLMIRKKRSQLSSRQISNKKP